MTKSPVSQPFYYPAGQGASTLPPQLETNNLPDWDVSSMASMTWLLEGGARRFWRLAIMATIWCCSNSGVATCPTSTLAAAQTQDLLRISAAFSGETGLARDPRMAFCAVMDGSVTLDRSNLGLGRDVLGVAEQSPWWLSPLVGDAILVGSVGVVSIVNKRKVVGEDEDQDGMSPSDTGKCAVLSRRCIWQQQEYPVLRTNRPTRIRCMLRIFCGSNQQHRPPGEVARSASPVPQQPSVGYLLRRLPLGFRSLGWVSPLWPIGLWHISINADAFSTSTQSVCTGTRVGMPLPVFRSAPYLPTTLLWTSPAYEYTHALGTKYFVHA